MVVVMQERGKSCAAEKANPTIEGLLEDGRTDLTLTIPKVIAYMHDSAPAFYPIPLRSTVEGFVEKLVNELGSYRYRADPETAGIFMEQLYSEPRPMDFAGIRKEKGFHQISSLYNIFSGRLNTMHMFYPCVGKVPLEIQRQREEKALEKTFCKKGT